MGFGVSKVVWGEGVGEGCLLTDEPTALEEGGLWGAMGWIVRWGWGELAEA